MSTFRLTTIEEFEAATQRLLDRSKSRRRFLAGTC